VSESWSSIAAGQDGRVVQLCYLVPDIEGAVSRWTRQVPAGPFFHVRFDLDGQRFGDRPAAGTLDVAVGYRRDMNIELAAYSGQGPAIYDPATTGVGYGLHHVQIACDDIDAALARHATNGEAVLSDHVVPGFGRAVMVDTRSLLGHFVEYGAWTPAVHDALAVMQAAHADWDGTDPLRPYPSLAS
jgi:hypothetical protein